MGRSRVWRLRGVRSMKFEWPIRPQCSAAQVGDEVVEVGVEYLNGSGVHLGPPVAERLGPPGGLGHRGVARFDVDVGPDSPELGLELRLGVLGDSGEQVPGPGPSWPRSRPPPPWCLRTGAADAQTSAGGCADPPGPSGGTTHSRHRLRRPPANASRPRDGRWPLDQKAPQRPGAP